VWPGTSPTNIPLPLVLFPTRPRIPR